MSILQRTRGTILTHRDTIKTETGVVIGFPRGCSHGEYQDMVLTGTTAAIREVKTTLRSIMANADREYWEYKDRQAKRRQQQRKIAPAPTMPSLPKIHVKKSNNPFELLAENDEHIDDAVDEFPALVPTDNATKAVSWGAHLNHQNQEESTSSNAETDRWSEW